MLKVKYALKSYFNFGLGESYYHYKVLPVEIVLGIVFFPFWLILRSVEIPFKILANWLNGPDRYGY